MSSSLTSITGRAPQGSVLGQVLCQVYINEKGKGFSCILSKFADDSKIANSLFTRAESINM